MGVLGRAEQLVVELVEAFAHRFFVVEHLDHLDAGDHLFDIAVEAAQLFLLPAEIGGGALAHGLDHQQHHAQHGDDDEGQQGREHQHHHEHADDGEAGAEDVGQGLGDHLPQGVRVVGVAGHDLAVGVGVEVFQLQSHHVVEHVRAHLPQDGGGDDHHVVLLQIAGDHADEVDEYQHQYQVREAGQVHVALADEGHQIAVDDGLDEIGAGHAGQGGEDDAEGG